jgi:hypothetical protein
MCAVKFAYIGSGLNNLKSFDIEERSYDPQGQVHGMSTDIFNKVPAIKEIAIVSTINNKSSLVYD